MWKWHKVAGVLLFATLIGMVISYGAKERKACEAKGGVLVQWKCVKPA